MNASLHFSEGERERDLQHIQSLDLILAYSAEFQRVNFNTDSFWVAYNKTNT